MLKYVHNEALEMTFSYICALTHVLFLDANSIVLFFAHVGHVCFVKHELRSNGIIFFFVSLMLFIMIF